MSHGVTLDTEIYRTLPMFAMKQSHLHEDLYVSATTISSVTNFSCDVKKAADRVKYVCQ